MQDYLTTREVADYLRLGERKIYELVAEQRIPCARVTGKILFPRRLVDVWVARQMDPVHANLVAPPPVVAGSHDPLLDWAVRESRCQLALLTCGSTAGLRHLADGQAVMAGLHAINPDGNGYNSALIRRELAGADMVLIQWAGRTQGLAMAPGNPLGLGGLTDAIRRGLRFARRQPGAGADLLLSHLLHWDQGLLDRVSGPIASNEADVADLIADDKADCGLCIEPVARRLRLDFIPLHLERFDLAMRRRDYFEPPAQTLLAFAQGAEFRKKAADLGGYDIGRCGTVSFNG